MGKKGSISNKAEIKKKAFLEAFEKTFGNVSMSCKAVGMSRTQFYRYMKNDAGFKEEIDSIEPNELLVDFAENALMKRISSGDTTAIIFTLKTKGKKRGYVEKQEIGITPESSTKPTIIFGDEEEENEDKQ